MLSSWSPRLCGSAQPILQPLPRPHGASPLSPTRRSLNKEDCEHSLCAAFGSIWPFRQPILFTGKVPTTHYRIALNFGSNVLNSWCKIFLKGLKVSDLV